LPKAVIPAPPVIPAQVGIYNAQDAQKPRWMPACAGMTG